MQKDLEKDIKITNIAGSFLLELATEMQETARYIQERAALEGDITTEASMQDNGKRLINVLQQLAGCYGDKSPLVAAKKAIIQKDIRDFITEIQTIFELPTPAHKIG